MSETDEMLFEKWHWDFLSTTNGKASPELVVKFAIAIRDEALAEAPLYKQGYDAGYCNGLAARDKEIAAVLDAVEKSLVSRVTKAFDRDDDIGANDWLLGNKAGIKAAIAAIRERLQGGKDGE